MDETLTKRLLDEAAYNHQAQAMEIAQLKEKLGLQQKEIEHLEATITKLQCYGSVHGQFAG